MENQTTCPTTRKYHASWTFSSNRPRTSTETTTQISSTNTASPTQILDQSLVGRLAIGTYGSWIVGRVSSLLRTRLITIVSVPMMLKLNSKIARSGSR
ncbi:hypothetical protein LINPERPRIM_LOCUS4634 [Linum perenne]